MAGWALLLPLLKRGLALGRLVRLLAARPPAAPRPRDPATEAAILRTVRRLYHPARRRPSDNCLERSLVLYRYLGQAGAAPRLVIGLAAGPPPAAGHAWVEVDGAPVGETPADLAGYRPVVAFDARGTVERKM